MSNVNNNITKKLLSKNFNENDRFTKKIAIYYKDIPWGIANATIYIENLVFPPREGYNDRFIKVKASYAGRSYEIISCKGEVDGALMSMKEHIERKLRVV